MKSQAVRIALIVALIESGGDPEAKSPGGTSLGLAQATTTWWADWGAPSNPMCRVQPINSLQAMFDEFTAFAAEHPSDSPTILAMRHHLGTTAVNKCQWDQHYADRFEAVWQLV